VGKLRVALWGCGGSLDDVEEAFALHNPSSQQAFEAHRVLVTTRHITTPSLFKKETWKKIDEENAKEEIRKGKNKAVEEAQARKFGESRAAMVTEHEGHLSKFEWNTSEQLKVSLMVQGTTTEAGWSIAQGGFGVVASENDQGWFGKGIYVSSSMRYAHQYAGRSASMGKKAPALLVCAIAPGNAFPIIQRKDGRSVEDGYQSHFTVGEHSLSFTFLR